MGNTVIGKIFDDEKNAPVAEVEQSETVEKPDSDNEQFDTESTENVDSNNSENNETETPMKTASKRGRKKEQ